AGASLDAGLRRDARRRRRARRGGAGRLGSARARGAVSGDAPPPEPRPSALAPRPSERRRAVPGGGAPSPADGPDPLPAPHPAGEALVGRSGRLSFAGLDAAANRAAHALVALGVHPGDRVAACLPNDVDLVAAFLGCMRLGALWVGVNRALAPPEKAHVLRDSGALVLLATPEVAEQLAPARP